jgi:hypothetical protein
MLHRVDVLAIIVFASIALLIPALVVARHFFATDPIFFLHLSWGRTTVGVIFAVLVTLVTLSNVVAAWLSPWLYKREHGNLDDYHGSSGLPLIGSAFVAVAGALLPPSVPVGICLLLLYVVDPAGLPLALSAIAQNAVS